MIYMQTLNHIAVKAGFYRKAVEVSLLHTLCNEVHNNTVYICQTLQHFI